MKVIFGLSEDADGGRKNVLTQKRTESAVERVALEVV